MKNLKTFEKFEIDPMDEITFQDKEKIAEIIAKWDKRADGFGSKFYENFPDSEWYNDSLIDVVIGDERDWHALDEDPSDYTDEQLRDMASIEDEIYMVNNECDVYIGEGQPNLSVEDYLKFYNELVDAGW